MLPRTACTDLPACTAIPKQAQPILTRRPLQRKVQLIHLLVAGSRAPRTACWLWQSSRQRSGATAQGGALTSLDSPGRLAGRFLGELTALRLPLKGPALETSTCELNAWSAIALANGGAPAARRAPLCPRPAEDVDSNRRESAPYNVPGMRAARGSRLSSSGSCKRRIAAGTAALAPGTRNHCIFRTAPLLPSPQLHWFSFLSVSDLANSSAVCKAWVVLVDKT